MQPIKAIETSYNGYRFRSRLEARWAVFFDVLGVKYEYESEGYELPDGTRYLPDFWLSSFMKFIEIKPATRNVGGEIVLPEGHKQQQLAMITGYAVITLCGTPGIPSEYDYADDKGSYQSFVNFPEGWDCYYYWCECQECHTVGIQFCGYADRNEHLPSCTRNEDIYCKGSNMATPKLISAYAAARSARFEYQGNKVRL